MQWQCLSVIQKVDTRLMFGVNAGKGGALLKRKHSRRVLTRATQMVSPGPSKLAD